MRYSFPADVVDLVNRHMQSGAYASEDELLREALRALDEVAQLQLDDPDEYRQTVAAVKEGVLDMEAGRMRSVRDLIEQARDGNLDVAD